MRRRLLRGGFDAEVARKALEAAGVFDAIDVQIHTAALRRAAEKARVP